MEVIKTSSPKRSSARGRIEQSTVPWFDDECRRARLTSFAWLKLFRTSSERVCKDLYIEANREYKEICRRKRRAYNESEAIRLARCNNATEFWKVAGKLNGKKFVISRDLSSNVLLTHFRELLNPELSRYTFDYAAPGFQNQVLDGLISHQEILLALKRLKDGKAPGSDGIPTEFYKYGSGELIEKLKVLFNNVLEYGAIPQHFKEVIIFPIHKKGCKSDPSNYRGISFLNASYKIFTTILQGRLMRWIGDNKLLKEFQAGFGPGYSTIDHIFVLRSIAETFLLLTYLLT